MDNRGGQSNVHLAKGSLTGANSVMNIGLHNLGFVDNRGGQHNFHLGEISALQNLFLADGWFHNGSITNDYVQFMGLYCR